MRRYYHLVFLLIFAALNSNGQTVAEQIQTADSLLKVEDFSGSLKIRNQVVLHPSIKNADLLVQQRYKQQLTEAHLAEDPAIAVAKTKKAFSYFNKLKVKPVDEQMDLYNLLYHSLAYNNQNEEALKTALASYQKLQKKPIDQDVIDLVYDIGFLYSRIGNYFEAITYYKKSLALYVKNNGEVNNDVALNYNNLAYVYSYAYNQKFTINYYKKAAQIWEKVYAQNNDEKDYLITVYQNLNATLIEYGALE
ncbi:MAG: tetratricopeptide repeat protein, partial [Bacteroidia bacterium]